MYFDRAKVGDKVWDYIFGEGKIIDINDHVFRVLWRLSLRERRAFNDYYYDGRMVGEDDGKYQRLFYYDNRPIVITQDDIMMDETNTEYALVCDPIITEGSYYNCIKNYDVKDYTRKIYNNNKEYKRGMYRAACENCEHLDICADAENLIECDKFEPKTKEELGINIEDAEEPLTVDDLEMLADTCEKLKIKPVDMGENRYFRLYHKNMEQTKRKVRNIVGTPKMVYVENSRNMYQCPGCKTIVGYNEKFCKDCGVELNWISY